jgi:hypothetical protein
VPDPTGPEIWDGTVTFLANRRRRQKLEAVCVPPHGGRPGPRGLERDGPGRVQRQLDGRTTPRVLPEIISYR